MDVRINKLIKFKKKCAICDYCELYHHYEKGILKVDEKKKSPKRTKLKVFERVMTYLKKFGECQKKDIYQGVRSVDARKTEIILNEFIEAGVLKTIQKTHTSGKIKHLYVLVDPEIIFQDTELYKKMYEESLEELSSIDYS